MSVQIRSETIASLVDPVSDVKRIGDGFHFTEGPVWNRAERCYYFVDVLGDKRWRWSEAGGMEVIVDPNLKGNGQAYDAETNLVVCEVFTSSLVRFNRGGGKDILSYHHGGKYLNGPNDVVIRDVDGGIYFTDPAFGRRATDPLFSRLADQSGAKRSEQLGFQGVYRVASSMDGSAELLVEEQEFMQPNGLCFSPDQSILYVNDTARGDIKAFDVASDGTLTGKRLFATGIGESIEPLDLITDEARVLGIIALGQVDGMKCDELGNVWVTGPRGLWIFAPDGEHLGVLEVPEVVGNFAWGGVDGNELFMCSASTVHVVTTLVAPAAVPREEVRY